jgi:tetratricopeptide (TPR) repeat protein
MDVYLALGRHEEALLSTRKAKELSRGYFGYDLGIAYVYAVLGKKDEARELLAQVQEQHRNEYLSSAYQAAVYASLGDKDQAFSWLEKAYSERDGQLLYLKISPMFDPLRSDPRFRELLKKIGL